MAKHKEKRDIRTQLKREMFWLRNKWYCFWKPSLIRMLKGKKDFWHEYWRS
jgi:hypothetical protein